MDQIRSTINGILEKHREILVTRSLDGNVRSLEIQWDEWNREYHDLPQPSFTDKERANVKYMVTQYGATETWYIIKEAAIHWRYLREQKSLANLPPSPTFGALFAFRDTIRSYLHARENAVKKAAAALQKLKSYESESAPPPAGSTPKEEDVSHEKISLVEMTKRAREEARREREKFSNETEQKLAG